MDRFAGPIRCAVCLSVLLLPVVAPLRAETDWLPFSPGPDPFSEACPIDLRFLNEKVAGQGGFIRVKDGEFTHGGNGLPVRFWAVNGPPHDLKGPELKRCARMLAKKGVNMVRIHGGIFDKVGEPDMAKLRHVTEIVEAMKAEGIYSYFSIYFPLWITPGQDAPWLKGYDGKKHPFAALFFNRDFQEVYRKWWTALLSAPTGDGKKTLVDEPAIAGLEIQNEDSFFFWTFSDQNIPDPQLRMLEQMFGDWAAKKYGSIPAALAKWNQLAAKRDAVAEGRLGFRPLWNVFSEKTPRDQDAAAFLLEVQTRFYQEAHAFLRKLGFKGPITASNWTTASPEVFGPLEKLSYAVTDFIDRHGYFSCNHKGESAEWSIRNGHTYSDRSAYRFDPEVPGKPKLFVHPAMDPHYAGKPSMISETTWNRPNRFRGEAPIYLSVFGALQHSDCIVHFALDGANWAVKPGYWMQPWTLMSPTMMGQFPATALLYRRGYVAPGPVLAQVQLNTNALLHLEGTPLPQDAALDELRLKDVPVERELKPGQRVDPLVHFAGRSEVAFGGAPTSVKLGELKSLIDRKAQTVRSGTGEVRLDYGKGLLVINAPKAQGVSGMVGGVPALETDCFRFSIANDLAHLLAVSLDDRPLAVSEKILLQVMSEEKASGFETESVGEGIHKIKNIGSDPWLLRRIEGTVAIKRADAAQLKVTALDFNGYLVGPAGAAKELKLQPATVYYLISK